MKEIVKGMVRKEVMTGTKFTHRYDEEDGSTVEWNGKFVREKRRASGLMTYYVAYWLPGLGDAGPDPDLYPLTAEKILCDVFMQDIFFL